MSKNKDLNMISRRRFLGQASCAAVGSSALFSTLFNMGMTAKLSANVLPGTIPSNDYKALVCLFLGGGNDSYNMLVPYDQSDYDDYAATRGDLALDRAGLHQISATSGNYGIHPGMPELQTLYNAGELAFVSNVGTLIKKNTTLTDYNGGNFLPVGLFSHADQIQQWQTSLPNLRTGRGWGGRIAEILQGTGYGFNSGANISMNVSLGGNNVYQTGSTVFPYSIDADGAVLLDGYNGNSAIDTARTAAINNQLDLQYQNLFEDTFNKQTKDAIDAGGEFKGATDQVNISTAFPDTSVGNDLKMVAKSIAAHSQLGFQRQTFFVFVGGWDHHDETLANQAAMLPMISEAVKAFRDALVNDLTYAGGNMFDKVTLFQCSDFGRTLTSNGKGSDHAWGGNNFIMGGGVNGGEVYGSYPTLNLGGNPLDTGRGRFIPTTSVDEYFAELGLWMGVQNNSDLEDMLPNIREFYSSGAGSNPIGFMA